MTDNVITLFTEDGRTHEWKFPDGTLVRMEVPKDEPPITVKHAVYCFSELINRIHEAVRGK